MNQKAGTSCKETLALMVLKTLDLLGPQHGYGIALAHRADLSRRPSGCESGHAAPPLPLKLEHAEAPSLRNGATSDSDRPGPLLIV